VCLEGAERQQNGVLLNRTIQPKPILDLHQKLFLLVLRQLQATRKELFLCLPHVVRYNESMLCPNDRTQTHQVKIVGHYGEPIIVDQCEQCGGIWFDESELFRAKQGDAERIESLDTGILRTLSTIEHPDLICPRDEATMQRFTDRYFPQDIVLMRCPSCHGIWLNRGIFTKYQQFRQGLMRVKKSPQDEKLKESIAQLTASYESGRSTGTLSKLGEFLSTPVDSGHAPHVPNTVDDDNIGGSALGILFTILRFIFGF
jgi:Zn-finger nucleic acid-binding protein